jgi:hypothetical protein
MLAFPNAAYASLEAGAIPHRVIESGTAEANSRNDREERTFRSPAVAASKIQLRHVRTMQRVEAVWDTATILVHKAWSTALSTEHGRNGVPKEICSMVCGLRRPSWALHSRPAPNPGWEEGKDRYQTAWSRSRSWRKQCDGDQGDSHERWTFQLEIAQEHRDYSVPEGEKSTKPGVVPNWF